MTPGPQKRFDREAVLERAMKVFWQGGYEATGMSSLLAEMGIGRQSLYDTFGGKKALYVEALQHYVKTRMGPILATLNRPGSPMGNVREVLRMWQGLADESGYCGCLVGNTVAELGHCDEEIAELLRGYMKALEKAFGDAFARAQEAGELDPRVDPHAFASLFVATSQGVALLSKVVQDRELPEKIVASALGMVEVSS